MESPEYPEAFTAEPRWPHDLAEDYSRAGNDDERRRMLLRFGYDPEHQQEVLRLFGPPTSTDSEEPKDVQKKRKRKIATEKRESQKEHRFQIWTAILTAFLGLITGLVVKYFGEICSAIAGALDNLGLLF